MNGTTRLSTNAVARSIAAIFFAAAPQSMQAQTRQDPPPPTTLAAIRSRDGTTIAYERSGKGPVLVLVAPALSDRSDAVRLAALLAPAFTVINFDRRGRGESGDTGPYAVAREIEDIEALIDAAGGKAALFGSSSGAALALEAADKLTSKVTAVAMFEPPFIVDDSRTPIPDEFFQEIGSLVTNNRRGDAVALFMTKGVGVPEEIVARMMQSPMWATMEERAHTLLYDGAIMKGLQSGKPLAAKRWKAITARALVIDGENSPAFLRNAVQALTGVLPAAKRHTLEGQDHSAVFTAPQSLVPVLSDFLLTRTGAAKRE